jgi:hypothetical protein
MPDKTFADHFEEWLKENDKPIPERGTTEYQKGYEDFINNYCFKDFKR